jgi:hypothetical protein
LANRCGQLVSASFWLIGYLAECLENPMLSPLFNDLGYYKAFATFCASYPCHLHINIAAGYRNHGVGAALIEAFAELRLFERPECTSSRTRGRGMFTSTSATTFAFFRRPIRTVRGLFSWVGN